MIQHRYWLLITSIVMALCLVHIHANEPMIDDKGIPNSSSSDGNLKENDVLYFENMTNEELEAICISRGFELVKELDENGKEREFTRENYIDAAKQCLDVEAEMEKILQEHPHLLDEIEAEAEKMRKEKQRLEKKLAQIQNEIEEEKVKAGDKFKTAFVDGVDGENDDEIQDKMEYIDETVVSENDSIESGFEKQDEVTSEEEFISNGENVFGDDNIQDSISSSNYSNDESNDEYMDLDSCCDKNKQGISANDENPNSNDDNTQEMAINHDESTTGSEKTLIVQEFIAEFREQVLKDFSRVCNLLLPVKCREPLMKFARPMLIVVKNSVKEAYDLVKRYTNILFQEIFNPERNGTTNQNNESH